MLVAGVILLVLTVVFAIIHVVQRRKIGHLLTAKQSTIGELTNTARAVAGELGGGGFEEMAALTGTVRCDSPLVAPLSGRPCLYYSMSVKRRYEEDYEREDSNGNRRLETRRGTETMSTQSEGTGFALVDASGTLPVQADGLDWDAKIETVDRFEPQQGGLNIGFGRFSMTVSAPGGRRRTLGYEYEEHIVPVDGQFTVVGKVSDKGGTLAMGRGGPIFALSRQTRDELIGSAKGTAQWTGIASGIGLIAGAILTIVGALT